MTTNDLDTTTPTRSDDHRGIISRRHVLRSGLLASGSAMALGLAACGSSSESEAPPPRPQPLPDLGIPPAAPTVNPAQGINLFAQEDLNFQTLFTLGAAGAGASEVGEVIATANQINASGPSYETYYDNFVTMAQQVGQIADDELSAGHLAPARSAFLRSASYYDAALYFVLGTSKPNREEATYRAMQQQWNLAAHLLDPPLQRVEIPIGKTTMPGDWMSPDNSGRSGRPSS